MFTFDDLPVEDADWRSGDPTMAGNPPILSGRSQIPHSASTDLREVLMPMSTYCPSVILPASRGRIPFSKAAHRRP
jgi:hypothetical protein